MHDGDTACFSLLKGFAMREYTEAILNERIQVWSQESTNQIIAWTKSATRLAKRNCMKVKVIVAGSIDLLVRIPLGSLD